ncbi:MAG: hypothetical protein U1B80_03750, partial [Anaerolineaceae bacterium]|nr:hypothetical protein [Anaerolineaceae bacterium]
MCLIRDEPRYILDPKEVHGEDFPDETFRVLKEKKIRLYGENIIYFYLTMIPLRGMIPQRGLMREQHETPHLFRR